MALVYDDLPAVGLRAESIRKACSAYTVGQTQTAMDWLRLAFRQLDCYIPKNNAQRHMLYFIKYCVDDAMRAVRVRSLDLWDMGKVEPL